MRAIGWLVLVCMCAVGWPKPDACYWVAGALCEVLNGPKQMRAIRGNWCLCACVVLDGPKQMRAVGWLVLVCMRAVGWPKTDACYWVAGACVHVWFCLSKTDACYWG